MRDHKISDGGEATPYLGPYLATHARPLGKGLPGLPGLPGALPGLSGTLPGLPGPYLAYLALTWRSSTASYLALPGPPSGPDRARRAVRVRPLLPLVAPQTRGKSPSPFVWRGCECPNRTCHLIAFGGCASSPLLRTAIPLDLGCAPSCR